MNKKIVVGIVIIIAIVAIGLFLLLKDNPSDSFIATNFQNITRTIDSEVTSVTKYHQEEVYYYVIDFNYDLDTSESGSTTIIYVYNTRTKNISYFNINDQAYHSSTMNILNQLIENEKGIEIDIDIFN